MKSSDNSLISFCFCSPFKTPSSPQWEIPYHNEISQGGEFLEGERLKEIRRDHHDTQESLAKKLGFSTPTVSKWEQGQSNPDLDTLVQICRMYHVTADYLLGLSDEDPLIWQEKSSRLSDTNQKPPPFRRGFLLIGVIHSSKVSDYLLSTIRVASLLTSMASASAFSVTLMLPSFCAVPSTRIH